MIAHPYTAVLETCLLAGTSSKGVCPECGAPVKRMVEHFVIDRWTLPKSDPRYRPHSYMSKKYAEIGRPTHSGRYPGMRELGWQPTCEHFFSAEKAGPSRVLLCGNLINRLDYADLGDVLGEMGAKVEVLIGDALEKLKEIPDNSLHCAITSPPYFGLRQYLFEGAVTIRKDLTDNEKTYLSEQLLLHNIKPKYGGR